MIDYTHPDCYRTKAIITKARRAASNKRGKQLLSQLNAYQVAFNEARKAGLPLPSVSDFTTPAPTPLLTDAEIAAELEDYASHDDYARYGIERSIQ